MITGIQLGCVKLCQKVLEIVLNLKERTVNYESIPNPLTADEQRVTQVYAKELLS